MPRLNLRTFTALVVVVTAAAASADTLRVATWNISAYTGANRGADIQNAVYGSYQGRSMSPDVIMAQEIESASAAASFVNLLNSAANSPKDWAASYTNLTGTDANSKANDQVVFYRTSKVTPLTSVPTLVLGDTGTSGAARQVYRWDFSLANDATNDVLSLYDNHLKAGDGSSDNTRRKVATDAIRADANSLASNYHAIFGGDMNVQSSTQTAYQSLVGSQSNNDGRFFDPINSPGTWNNSATYKFLDTQDPAGSGGMDDRHDQLLLDGSFGDGSGLEYAGQFGTKYSTTTWDDPNHSYRVWGNDGTSFNNKLTVNGNAMVGSSIAQSLINAATPTANNPGGHLPVFLDLKYQAVPEPSAFAALGLGAVAFLRRRKR